MGLVVVAISARFGAYDALADPLGWLLVLLGSRALTVIPERRLLLALAALALVVSSVVWWPATQAWLDAEHPSLRWALTLPQLGVEGLVCLALARRASTSATAPGTGNAARHEAATAARWLRLATAAVGVVAVLPVLAFAAGSAATEVWSYVAATAVVLWVIWLLFAYAARSWVRDVTADNGDGPPAP